MSKHLKVLFLSLLAAVASATTLVAATQAAEFRAGSYPATVTGEQVTQVTFTLGLSTVKCTTMKSSGVLEKEGLSAYRTTPTFEGCTSGLSSVDFKWNGCEYELTVVETVNGNPDEVAGYADIRCPAGQQAEMTITSSPDCTAKFPPQNEAAKVIFTNKTAVTPMDVVADTEGTAVHYTTEGLGCPGETGTYNNGVIKGSVTTTTPSGHTVT